MGGKGGSTPLYRHTFFFILPIVIKIISNFVFSKIHSITFMNRIILLIVLLVNCQLYNVNCLAQQGQWTWMNGSNLPNQPAVYGTQGFFDAGNTPTALYEACEWTDKAGNFWLCGGGESIGDYNDLWEFKAGIDQWAWIRRCEPCWSSRNIWQLSAFNK